MKPIAIVLAALVLSTACVARGAPADTRDENTCGTEIEAVVSELIRHAIETEELPDYGLIAEQRPILVSEVVSDAGCRLTERALPADSYRLLSDRALQDHADEHGKVVYLFVSRVRVEGDEAFAHAGVSMKLAEDSVRVALCCCSRDATLVRENDGWRFREWGTGICA